MAAAVSTTYSQRTYAKVDEADTVSCRPDPIRVENVSGYSRALRQARVPFSLHVYPSGGHGYGMRRTKEDVTNWPERAEEWLRSLGHLERSRTR